MTPFRNICAEVDTVICIKLERNGEIWHDVWDIWL